jgi:hypothetical protein
MAKTIMSSPTGDYQMPERKYSIAEIDRMRREVCDNLHSQNTGFLRDSVRQIEEKAELLLRTYMLNGTDPEELEAAGNKRRAEHREWTMKRERENGINVTTSSDGKQVRNVKPGDPLWNKMRPWDPFPVQEPESVDSSSWTGR